MPFQSIRETDLYRDTIKRHEEYWTRQTQGIYQGWIANGYDTSATTVSTNIIYHNWIAEQTAPINYSTGTSSVFQYWIAPQVVGIDYTRGTFRAPELTAEALEEMRLRQEERLEADRRAAEERRVALEAAAEVRAAARERARALLGMFLNDLQKEEVEKTEQFHVTGSKGRRYCIRMQGQSGNVDLLKPDGTVKARLCAHPGSDEHYELLPEGDAWLQQMLHLRADEDDFLRTANVQRGDLTGVL